MAISNSKFEDLNGLGLTSEPITISKSPASKDKRPNREKILDTKLSKLTVAHADAIRKELGVSGIMIIGFEDIKDNDTKKLVKSGKDTAMSSKLGKIYLNILNSGALQL